MRTLLLLCMCGTIASSQTPGTIKVLTYNVQFLPGIAEAQNKRPKPE